MRNLLQEESHDGAAYRLNGLRNLERALRTKSWASPAEQAKALVAFRSFVRRLALIDAEWYTYEELEEVMQWIV